MALDINRVLPLHRIDNTLPPILVYNSSSDTMATITGANYFNAAADRMPVGSLVLIIASDGTGWRRVVSNTGSSVTIGALS